MLSRINKSMRLNFKNWIEEMGQMMSPVVKAAELKAKKDMEAAQKSGKNPIDAATTSIIRNPSLTIKDINNLLPKDNKGQLKPSTQPMPTLYGN
jgi:hypothetical protein